MGQNKNKNIKMTNIQINGPEGCKLKNGVLEVKKPGPSQSTSSSSSVQTKTRTLYTKCYLLIPCFFDKTHNMKLVEHQTTNPTI